VQKVNKKPVKASIFFVFCKFISVFFTKHHTFICNMSAITFNRYDYSNQDLIWLYKSLLKPRLIEEKMILLLRQNRISKWFSAWGQEAISVGATLAMQEEEYILPMHRNLGVFTSRGLKLEQLFLQFQGKKDGFTKGRDRSFHFGYKEKRIVGMISHLGPQLGIADGIALANQLSGSKLATLVFSGDGGTSEGDFHEALNVASVWNLPVIFAIESNGYGLSTPSSEQFKTPDFSKKAEAYGINYISVDGNNIIDVYHKTNIIADLLRNEPQPFLIEYKTFRMRGHEESSGTKYIPKELMTEWAKKDPINNYEDFLLNENIITPELRNQIRGEIMNEINQAVEFAFDTPEITANIEEELSDVFAPYNQNIIESKAENIKQVRFIDAVSDGLDQAMKKYDNLIIMGQDIAEYGGVFKVTEGFVERYGKERVRNTPLCESAIIGTALGLSLKGYKAIVEMQFADFVTCGFNQIVNNLAKLYYRWNENADVIIRMPTGAGVGAGPFHSQSNEAWFFHTPGLQLFYPSNPYDAKGLMIAAVESPNPSLFFEHKALYRSISGAIPDGYYNIEIGKAKKLTEGKDVTIITYGAGVHWANQVLSKYPEISTDLIDLRTLMPWDKEMVLSSVQKTGKALILHEDTMTGGIGAEISAVITKECFKYLDAPVYRVASLDTPVPFAGSLEVNFLAKSRFENQLNELLNW